MREGIVSFGTLCVKLNSRMLRNRAEFMSMYVKVVNNNNDLKIAIVLLLSNLL